MNIKKFEAATFEEALLRVKTEMGPDALILSTEEVHRGLFKKPSVEITAAVERKEKAKGLDAKTLEKVFPHRRHQTSPVENIEVAARKKPAPTPAATPVRKAVPTVPASDLEMDLLSVGLSLDTARAFARQIVMDYSRQDCENAEFLEKVKTRFLSAQMKTLLPDIFQTRRSWAVVGAPGSGKTSFTVKLAVSLRGQGVSVRLSSCDRRKVVGRQELAAYAKLIEVPFHAEGTQEKRADQVFLLDTPSVDRGGPLYAQVEKHCRDLNTLVVLDASQRLEELLRSIDNFSRLAPVALAFTRLDVVGSAGVIYDVLKTTKLPLLACSVSPELSKGAAFFEVADLARFLVRKPIVTREQTFLMDAGAAHGTENLV
ncbi:hypothetical protein K2X33_04330 [bacterium]|nr:hypothetical protein [bacterium]